MPIDIVNEHQMESEDVSINGIHEMRSIIDQTIDEYDLNVNKSDVHLCTSEWKSLIGRASYNQVPLKKHYGKRVSLKRKTGEHTITVNRNINDDTQLKNTLLHELAHIEDYVRNGKCSHHGWRWKQIAMRIGCNGERTSKKPVTTEYKYEVRCTECGYTIGRHKKSKLVKYHSHYSCGKCGGNFERVK